jgi:hypothetical protein
MFGALLATMAVCCFVLAAVVSDARVVTCFGVDRVVCGFWLVADITPGPLGHWLASAFQLESFVIAQSAVMCLSLSETVLQYSFFTFLESFVSLHVIGVLAWGARILLRKHPELTCVPCAIWKRLLGRRD